MTEEQIQNSLVEHANLIERAEREQWFMPPIPLIDKELRLRRQAEIENG
jgi:hypothetical protein